MRKIFVCSPYRGSGNCLGNKESIEKHIDLAKNICEAIACEAYMPIAPHIYFTTFLDDYVESDRRLGLNFSLSLLSECSAIIVFEGCCCISNGMLTEIRYAKDHNIPIIFTDHADTICFKLKTILGDETKIRLEC